MAKVVRALFVCEGNRHRSPTAERLYSATLGVKSRSAGVSALARVELTDELLAWADAVFVMERQLEKLVRRRFAQCRIADSCAAILRQLEKLVRRRFAPALEGKTPICLNIPDDYQFMQAELVAVLTERLTPHLGAPSGD